MRPSPPAAPPRAIYSRALRCPRQIGRDALSRLAPVGIGFDNPRGYQLVVARQAREPRGDGLPVVCAKVVIGVARRVVQDGLEFVAGGVRQEGRSSLPPTSVSGVYSIPRFLSRNDWWMPRVGYVRPRVGLPAQGSAHVHHCYFYRDCDPAPGEPVGGHPPEIGSSD